MRASLVVQLFFILKFLFQLVSVLLLIALTLILVLWLLFSTRDRVLLLWKVLWLPLLLQQQVLDYALKV